MSSRNFNLPSAAQNPFEDLGFDKGLLEVLLKAGDGEAVSVAVSGMKRVVSKALHPDTGLDSSEATIAYLDAFLQATDRIERMDPDDAATLAKAYTKRGTRKIREPAAVVESRDLHDGRLLASIVDMVAASGESISSARGTRILVRPLDFDISKPSDSTERSYQWYPPDKARVNVFETDHEGITTVKSLQQLSFTKMMRKKLQKNNVSEESRLLTSKIAEMCWPMMEPFIDMNLVRGGEVVTVLKHEDEHSVFMSDGSFTGRYSDASSVLKDGQYEFGFERFTSSGLPDIHDTYYASDDQSARSEGILLAGFADIDFMKVIEKQIFDGKSSNRGAPRLPVSSRSSRDVYAFSVPDKLLRYSQKMYSPQIPDSGSRALVLATNSDHELQILGTMASVTQNAELD